MEKYTVPIERLRKKCHVEQEIGRFGNTLELDATEGVIGQDRAVLAMEFGLAMDAPGYNIFVVGPHGTGKSTYTEAIVEKASERMRNLPKDWCYIHNFRDEDRPRIIAFPAGTGKAFQNDTHDLVEDLRELVSKAFEDGEYEEKRDHIILSLQEKLDQQFNGMKEEARKEGFDMKPVPPRFVFIPLKDGKQMLPEVFEKLTPEEKKQLDEKGRKLTKSLDETLKESQRLEDQAKEDMRELEQSIALSVIRPRVEIVKEKYSAYDKVMTYMEELIEDAAYNHKAFLQSQQPEKEKETSLFTPEEKDPLQKYAVNVFVNNETCESAPVVIEPNPNYYNLFGKLEYKSHMLSMSTDFTMLRPGAIHRANGGFLILQIKDVLRDANAWETLKKAIEHQKAVVENIGEEYRLVPSGTIRPEPVPLDLKVIIISDPEIYYLLYAYDDDLKRLFKVRVDFDVDMPRTPENLKEYASFVTTLTKKENLLPFKGDALGKVIEYGSRIAGDQNRLSTRFNKVTEVIYEAEALAKSRGKSEVEESHVMEAVKERIRRENRLEERIREQILEGKVIIHTEGEEVGQINGLSVLDTGGYAFGMPTRITARTYAGDQGVINIERETKMSGSIHTKGVLTLSGFLGGVFAQKFPLGLTAQVTFEQSYGGVEGDSASSAELYAILSSLSDVPLTQAIAVTGSVDQRGEIQPIGGVTEKIEGFFDVCKAKGLTGGQGVMIPVQNIDNLMLKDEVIAAVEEGVFRIYAVRSIDEGIEVLTGMPSGRKKEGGFTEGSVFDLADRKLKGFAEAIRRTR